MNMKKLFYRTMLLLAIVMGVLSVPARADYTLAYLALQKKDYQTAFTLMEQAAGAGDPRAMHALGMMYWSGMGVKTNPAAAIAWVKNSAATGNPLSMNFLANAYLYGGKGVRKNIAGARKWADKSARLGNATGQLLYCLTVINGPELNDKKDGKVDMAKHQALAKRTLDERKLEQKAYTMLARAVEQGNRPAKVYAAATLMDKVGPNNKKRALLLLQGVERIPPSLQRAKRAAELLLKLGDSYSNVQTFLNAKTPVFVTAIALAKKAGYLKEGACSSRQMRITKMAVSRPLAHAVYLPVSAPPLKDFYLIAGDWQETWTFDACGHTVSVPVAFQADGLGGAYFQTRLQ